jgi:hypothetical protein
MKTSNPLEVCKVKSELWLCSAHLEELCSELNHLLASVNGDLDARTRITVALSFIEQARQELEATPIPNRGVARYLIT